MNSLAELCDPLPSIVVWVQKRNKKDRFSFQVYSGGRKEKNLRAFDYDSSLR